MTAITPGVGIAALLLLAVSMFAVPCTAAAKPPAGIVMSVTGTTEPPLSAMTEIPANAPIRLGPGSELTFLHYARCRLVTVVGGTVTLSRTSYRTDGRIEAEKEAPCPHVYALKGAGYTNGGLTVRGGPGMPRWPTDSEFLLTGRHAARVRAAAIYAEDRPETPLATLELKGRRAVEPSGAPPLVPNRRYVLRLRVAHQSGPAGVTFIGVAADGIGSLVVLRVD